jgi:predicted permease
MLEIVGLTAPFFALILLGFIAGRTWRREEGALLWLNGFVIYFALPALFFQLISRTPVEKLAQPTFVFATTLATYTAFALSFTFAAIRSRGNIAEATIQGLVGGYGNVGYLGPPLALLAMGEGAAAPAALIFCFDVALVFTLAPIMMAVAGAGGKSIRGALFDIPRQVLLHPFIVATILAGIAAFAEFRPPAPVDRLLDGLASASAPCALFALGVTVASRPLKRIPGELPVLLLVKLVLHPILALAILSFIGGFERIWIETGVLMASLPPAATIYLIASQAGIYLLRASTAILAGTALSMFTVTAVLYLITHDRLPLELFAR